MVYINFFFVEGEIAEVYSLSDTLYFLTWDERYAGFQDNPDPVVKTLLLHSLLMY